MLVNHSNNKYEEGNFIFTSKFCMNEIAKKSNIQNYFDFLYFVFLTKSNTLHMACMSLKDRCRIDVYMYEKMFTLKC